MARIIFLILFFSIFTQAAYFDEISINQNGNPINATNPIGVRLTDGSSYLTSLPVSQSGAWSVTANAGTNLNTSLLSLQSGANSNLDKNAIGALNALNQTVTVATNGMTTAIVQLTGTFNATIVFEASVDGGTTWFSVYGIYLNTNLIPINALNSTGQTGFYTGAYTNLRARVSAYTSGTLNVVVNTGTGAISNIATQFTRLSDNLGLFITSTNISSKQRLDVAVQDGLALETTQATQNTRIGDLTETAPASDTASSGLNGRLQRIAQRISSLIAVFNPLTAAPANNASGIVVRPVTSEYATFSVVSTATVVGNNKSMLAIQNTGTSVVRIREIWIINDQTTAVTGVAGTFEVRRIASFTGGTSLTPNAFDSSDSLPSGISAATGATVSTETVLLRTGVWSTDEWGPGTSDTESFDHAIQNTEPFWKQTPNGKAITIRQNEAVHVKFATNSTAGAFNIRLIFTTE